MSGTPEDSWGPFQPGSEQILSAWRKSFLSGLPEDATEKLLETAHEVEFEAGQSIYREVPNPRLALVGLIVSGVICVYITSPRGRRVTLRYVRPGEVVGLTSLFIEGVHAGADAATPGSMLRLDPLTLRHLAKSNEAVSWPLVCELARRVNDDGQMRILTLFGSVRARVARHLLELMVEREGDFAAKLTQQEIADAVGSVREVVARTMLELGKAGVVERDGRWIAIKNRERLTQIAHEDEDRGRNTPPVESGHDQRG